MDNQKIVMYYYFDKQGNKVWTSNENLALSRAKALDTEVYRVELESDKK